MEYLVSTSYRTTGRSAIWKLDLDRLELRLFREDQYYQAGQKRKDYIYFGMGIYKRRIYCVGGSVLSVLDLDGNLVERRDEGLLHDAHDLRLIDGHIFCTNTGHDTVEIFSTSLEHKKSIFLKELPCFHGMKLMQKNENSIDSLHANFLFDRMGTVFVTHSFICEQDRRRAIKLAAMEKLGGVVGWQPHRNEGVVLGLRSGKILNSGGVITVTGDRVLYGLNGAHDGLFYDNKFYVNSTHNIETLIYDEDFQLMRRIQYDVGMLLRGLFPINDTTLLVGGTRIDEERTASSIYYRVLKGRGSDRFNQLSTIEIVDSKTGKILESIAFDAFQGVHPEIYKIIPLEST